MDRMEVSGTSDKGSIPFGCTLKPYLQRVRLFIIVFSAHVWYMMLQRRAFYLLLLLYHVKVVHLHKRQFWLNKEKNQNTRGHD